MAVFLSEHTLMMDFAENEPRQKIIFLYENIGYESQRRSFFSEHIFMTDVCLSEHIDSWWLPFRSTDHHEGVQKGKQPSVVKASNYY